MYLTEIAPINIRGAMGVLHQLALTIGICVSQLLGLRQLLGSATLWPILLAGSAVPFILSCCVLPFYPDSPRWLLVKKGNEELATKGQYHEISFSVSVISLHLTTYKQYNRYSTQGRSYYPIIIVKITLHSG